MPSYPIEERRAWQRWVTPKPLAHKPIHRWYVFPHSFTSELVHALIAEWGLEPKDHILDPFVGAGTTLLAAKEKGIPATGYDLSPLAVLAARTKIANYSLDRLEEAWNRLQPALCRARWNGPGRRYPKLVEKALPGRLLAAFDTVGRQIAGLPCSASERDFFRLALLKTIPRYSRAVASGGWLKWVERPAKVATLVSVLTGSVEAMLSDLRQVRLPRRVHCQVRRTDARQLPDRPQRYSGIITSPPYPNRHDYTRVFGIELMLGFLDWEQTRQLRYQSFHSHPEAHPKRPEADGYRPPASLVRAVAHVKRNAADARVASMLEGYFVDMYLCLREMKRVCRTGARIGLVVGNAQYCGEPILVDELTAEVGEQAGLQCLQLISARYRGNSAQQMGAYGRHPSRESVVVLRNP